MVPMEMSDVRLVSEQLHIAVAGYGWEARAIYELANDGPGRVVKFGVPMAWNPDDVSSRIGGESIEEGARRIKIEINGVRVPCVMSVGERVEFSRRSWSTDQVEGWCVAEIALPAGRRSILSLGYPGGIRDWGEPAYIMASRVVYWLEPAGYWRGPVERLFIEVDVRGGGDRTAWTRVVSPPGAELRNGKFVWEFRNVDIKRLGAVLVDVGLRLWDLKAPLGALVARAVTLSATPLAGNLQWPWGSGGAAIDGDPRSAVCLPAPVPGWTTGMEVKLSPFTMVPAAFPGGCRIDEFLLTPGDLSSDQNYEAHGRVERGRIESCEDPSDGFEFEVTWRRGAPSRVRVPNPHRVGDPPVEVLRPLDKLVGETSCVRLRILEVKAGTQFNDVCVGEFVPRMYCPAVASEPTSKPLPRPLERRAR
jgi:hypothetical protein